MANTSGGSAGPVDGVPTVLQPVARFSGARSVLIVPDSRAEWNASASVASAAFHIDTLPASSSALSRTLAAKG